MIHRRELLQKSLALGGLTVISTSSVEALLGAWEEKEAKRHPTPGTVLGPFYKKRAPESRTLRLTNDPGLPLSVKGNVLNTRGELLVNATVEVWHTDHFGHYDLDGYRFRAKLLTDSKGAYDFQSVMPGHYPDRVAQHVHYLVTAPGHKPLVTQLYFATDPVFQGDPDKNFKVDPLVSSRELVRPVQLVGDPKTIEASVSFDLCLERV